MTDEQQAIVQEIPIQQSETPQCQSSKQKPEKPPKMPKAEVMQVMVNNTLNVFSDPQGKSKNLDAKPLYRIAFATLPNSNQALTIYDKSFKVEKGFNEIALKCPPKNFLISLEKHEVWDKEMHGGQIYVRTSPIDIHEALSCIRWRDYLENFIDDTGKKSQIIKDLAKINLIPYKRQNLNPHAIILTNSGTAKSTTFSKIMGEEPASSTSEAGMFGSVEEVNGQRRPIVGSLAGEGMAVFDEFPDIKYTLVNRMLNYLETGETIRKLVVEINCSGSKTVTFLGNYTELTEEDFMKNIVGLATEKALDRVGRRFGFIIFNELPKIDKSRDFDLDETSQQRSIIKYAVEHASRKIDSIMKNARKWMGEQDSEYEMKVLDIKKMCADERVKHFLEGCMMQTPRIKCGAAKLTIIENLDLIISSKSLKTLYKQVLKPQIEANYDKLKQYNLDSFLNFKHEKFLKFKIDYEEKTKDGYVMSYDEFKNFIRAHDISERTGYNYKDKITGDMEKMVEVKE